MPETSATKFVVVFDLYRYGIVIKLLQDFLGSEAASQFQHSLHDLAKEALKLKDLTAPVLYVSTGDGAIVVFDSAFEAHSFAERLHKLAEDHNLTIQAFARLHFRMGIATHLAVPSTAAPQEITLSHVTVAITDASRLESQCLTGQVLISEGVWVDLKPERLRKLYAWEQIWDKHGVAYEVYRRKVVEPAPAKLPQPGMTTPQPDPHETTVEFEATLTLRFKGSPETFSELSFMTWLREKVGVDTSKIRIISKEEGSVKIVIAGDSNELARIADACKGSPKARREFARSVGLKSLVYWQDGKQHTIQVETFGLPPMLVRVALAVAACAAAVAVAAGISVDYKVAVLGVTVMSVLAFCMLLVAARANGVTNSHKPLALNVARTFVLLIFATAGFMFTSFFFSFPKPLTAYLGGQPSPEPTAASIVIKLVPPMNGVGGPDSYAPIGGEVSGAYPRDAHIVIYSRTDAWYVQPTDAASITPIENGKWESEIHLGTDYAALLVKSTFVRKNKLSVLPPVGGDVIARAVVRGEGSN